jgi:hypothetical protein
VFESTCESVEADQVDGSRLKVEANQYVLKNGDRQPDAWTGQTGQAGIVPQERRNYEMHDSFFYDTCFSDHHSLQWNKYKIVNRPIAPPLHRRYVKP